MFGYRSGKTSLIALENFQQKFTLPNLLVKDESKNPFGTWKDRRSDLIIKKAKKDFVDKIVCITSGNAGYSLAKFAQKTKIKIVSVIDKSLPNLIKETLTKNCYKVIETDLSEKILKPEEIVAMARENDEEVIWDATNGFHEAYETLIREVKKEKPDYLVCPIGSGEGFVGLYDGLKHRKLKTKLIGVKPQSSQSIADKLNTKWTPYSAKIQAIVNEGNQIIELDEDAIKSAYDYAKNYIDCEPSSAIVFGVFEQIKFQTNEKIIVVNSGKGLI